MREDTLNKHTRSDLHTFKVGDLVSWQHPHRTGKVSTGYVTGVNDTYICVQWFDGMDDVYFVQDDPYMCSAPVVISKV